MEGLCVPGVTRAVVVAILYLSRRCDVRIYRSCAGVVTRGLPLRGRSAVRPVSGIAQYGHCNLLPWPHLQSSCLLAACLRHIHADEQEPWASFICCFSESVEKGLFSVLSFHNCDLNCLPSVSCQCLNDHSRGACSLIVYGSLNKHEKQCLSPLQ